MAKTLKEFTNKDLLLKLPLYQRVEIIWNSFEEKTIHIEKWDNFHQDKREYEAYETDYTDDFQTLINFISQTFVIDGKCPSCNKYITLSVDKIELDKKLMDKCVRAYSENQIDDDEAYIPDPEYVMKERIEMLLDSGGYFDKLIHCTMCSEIHRVSYKIINDIDKSKKIYLIKVGQYPSLRAFSDYNTRACDNLLKDIDALGDYRKGHHMQVEGYHIAAFTYLRRVMEKFVFYKFDEVKDNLLCTDKVFRGKPMEKKIEIWFPLKNIKITCY